MALLDGVKLAGYRNAQQKDDEQRDPNLYPGWHVHRKDQHHQQDIDGYACLPVAGKYHGEMVGLTAARPNQP
jgi:hypothetical protein